MIINIRQLAASLGFYVACIVMLLVGIYKIALLLLGTLAWGVEPLSEFYVAGILEGPMFLASVATAWRWPWVVELVALLTLVVIFARFNPWTISPFQKGRSLEYAFILAANVAFFARMSLRRRGDQVSSRPISQTH
jgi:hypothetical protein